MTTLGNLRLNEKACELIKSTVETYRLPVSEYETNGNTLRVIDAGVDAAIDASPGESIGLLLAKASMGTLGDVCVRDNRIFVDIPNHPHVATLGCQLGGWCINIDGKNAIGSGPARIPARKPGKIIEATGYHEKPEKAALLLESRKLPGMETCRTILEETGVKDLYIAAFRDDTITGLINVLARVVEVGVYRLYNLGFDIKKIRSAKGSAPIPELDDDVMYTSNDAIIYGGTVEFEVDGWNPELTKKAVSESSPAYGKPFREIFNEAGCDFYKIDPAIFAPARIVVKDAGDGTEYSAGRII